MSRAPRFTSQHLLRGAALLFGLLLPTTARAQDSVTVMSDSVHAADAWRVNLRPYLFLAGVSGSLTAGNRTIPINSSFKEIVQNLQLSLFTAVTAEKGRWGVYGDFQYISLSAEGTGQLGVDVGLKNIIGEVDATFRPARAASLRFVGGMRVYRVEQTVNFDTLPDVHGTTTVYDPIIGAIGGWDLGDKWQFEVRGDIGGFGLSSEFTSQLSLVALYDVSKTVSIPIGYRTLNYRIKDDKVWMDTGMGGLVVGVDIKL